MVVSESAFDLAGNSTPAGATIRLDLTSPSVAITSPSDGLETSASSVEVQATVSDALSGIDVVTCNGIESAVLNGTTTCLVPLLKGINSIVVHARDIAGNTKSTGLRVRQIGAPTTVILTPSVRTALVNEQLSLALTDDFGSVVLEASWVSSDSNVVSVSTDDPPVLTAVGTGSATITVTKDSLIAEATLTVVAGTELPSGSTRWQSPGIGAGPIIYTHRIDDSVPHMFVQKSSPSEIVANAMTPEGQHLRTEVSPGNLLMGDSFGGVLTELKHAGGWNPWNLINGVARIAGPTAAMPWRYESPGYINTLRPAQSPDGTIYFVEKTQATDPSGTEIGDTAVVILDGNTGRVIQRVILPRSRWTYTQISQASKNMGCSVTPWERGVNHSGIVVGANGHAYLMTQTWNNGLESFVQNGACLASAEGYSTSLAILEFSTAGLIATHQILEEQTSSSCPDLPYPYQLLPDGLGGVISTSYTKRLCEYYEEGHRTIRLDASGAVSIFPYTQGYEIAMTSEGGTAYLRGNLGNTGFMAKGVTTWTTKWQDSVDAEPISTQPDESVVIKLSDGTLQIRDIAGATTGTSTGVFSTPRQAFRTGGWLGFSQIGVAGEKIALPVVDDGNSYQEGTGNREGQNSTGAIVVNNSLGTAPLLIKPEETGLKPWILPAGKVSRVEIDGVKPDAWRAPEAPLFSGDWYKVNTHLGVFMTPSGEPARIAPSIIYALLVFLPECDFGSSIPCPPSPPGVSVSGYDYWGGRKKEPEWTQVHSDWLYVPQ